MEKGGARNKTVQRSDKLLYYDCQERRYKTMFSKRVWKALYESDQEYPLEGSNSNFKKLNNERLLCYTVSKR